METTKAKGRGRGQNKKSIDDAVEKANEASRQLGRQRQAAATKPVKKTPAKASAKEPSKGPGKQQQANSTSDAGKQGASAAGKAASGELRGGTKQVLITETVMTGRSGRPVGTEDYPFGDLQPAHKEAGTIVGPSFFIPMTDGAEAKLAAARKRHKALFWSRKRNEQIDGKGTSVEGLRIWRGTPELADIAKR